MSRPLVDERVMEFIRALADESGYRIVEVTTRGGASYFMEIVLDKDGGITLGECGEFNRKVTVWMDKENIAGWHYTIDVCSPGLDKELRTDSAFSWAVGKEVLVTLREPVNSRTSYTGKLVRVDGASVVLGCGGDVKEITLDRSNIVRTKLRIVL